MLTCRNGHDRDIDRWGRCRECVRAQRKRVKANRRADPEKRAADAERNREYLRRPDIQERERERVKTRAQCSTELVRERERTRWKRLLEDPEKLKEWNARRRQRYADDRGRSEKLSERREAYKQPDVADLARARSRSFKQANSDAVNAWNQNRRAAKRKADGAFTKHDIAALLTSQAGRCCGCSIDITNEYTIDHITPLARGGSNWPSNLQLLCGPCNSSKGAKTMEEWRAERESKAA